MSAAASHHLAGDGSGAAAGQSEGAAQEHVASADPALVGTKSVTTGDHHQGHMQHSTVDEETAAGSIQQEHGSVVAQQSVSGQQGNTHSATSQVVSAEHQEPPAAAAPVPEHFPNEVRNEDHPAADTASNYGSVRGSVRSASALSVETSSMYDTDMSDAYSNIGSSSVSATSSVYKFVEEFGRKYHSYKEGKYYLPNDEKEQNRLDLQHAIAVKLLGGRLFLAPLNRPRSALDIGTGTGLWAIEFAEQFPETSVLGTDLSPIQPDYVPPNCHFEIEDCEDEWVYAHKFDYIHGRYLAPFLTDFPKLFSQVFNALEPGGYAEFYEAAVEFRAIDNTLEGTCLQRWNRLLIDGVAKTGRSLTAAQEYKKYMADAGFVNIVERVFHIPMNPWAKGDDQKMLGAMQMANNLAGVDGITQKIFRHVLGWTQEATDEILEEVKRDMQDRKIHAYVPIMTIYAVKPLQT